MPYVLIQLRQFDRKNIFPNITYNIVPNITAGRTSQWHRKAPFERLSAQYIYIYTYTYIYIDRHKYMFISYIYMYITVYIYTYVYIIFFVTQIMKIPARL